MIPYLIKCFVEYSLAFSVFFMMVGSSYASQKMELLVGVEIGTMGGRALEHVFIEPTSAEQLSQLTWDFGPIPVAKLSFGYPLLDCLEFRASFQRKVDSITRGSMVDLDWIAYVEDYGSYWPDPAVPTFRSVSDVQTRRADESLIEIKLALFSHKRVVKTSLSGIVGYSVQSYAWDDRAGDALYIVPHYNMSDQVVGLYYGYVSWGPGEVGISYRQDSKIPYLGLEGTFEFAKFALDARLVASPLVRTIAFDEHHFTGDFFRDEFKNGIFYAADLGLAYTLSPKWTLRLAYQIQHLKKVRGMGNVDVIGDQDYILGDEAEDADEDWGTSYGAGMSRRHQKTSFSVRYVF